MENKAPEAHYNLSLGVHTRLELKNALSDGWYIIEINQMTITYENGDLLIYSALQFLMPALLPDLLGLRILHA